MCAPMSSPAITAPPGLGKQSVASPRPAPSPLVTAAHRLVLRSPTSSSPWAPRNLRVFWLSCRDPSSAPASTPLSRCLTAGSFRFAFLSNVPVPSQSYSWRWKPEHPRWLLPEAEQHPESGWSFPMLGALTHRGSALKATEEIRTKYKILTPPPVKPPPDNVPRPARKHNYYRLHPRLGLQPAPRCSSSWVFRSAPSWTDRCQFHQRGNGAAHTGRTGCQTPLH